MPGGGTGPLSADGGVISTLRAGCHFNLALIKKKAGAREARTGFISLTVIGSPACTV